MKRTARQRYRVLSSKEQEGLFPALFGAQRAVYNMFLWEREQLWEAKQLYPEAVIPSMNTTVSNFAFKNLPEEYEWLKQYPAWTVQKSAEQAKDAYSKWWDALAGRSQAKHKKPRYKKRGKSRLSMRIEKPKTGFKIERLNRNKVRVFAGKKIGWLVLRDSYDELPDNPSGLTLVQESSGKVFASFIVQQKVAEPKIDNSTDLSSVKATAADLGVVELLVWVNTNGERGKVKAPRAYRQAEKRLKKLQKAYSRKQKDSKNQEKARLKLNQAHEKVRNVRQDQQRKIASKLASENQVVCLESLNVAGMTKNRNLAKSISDASFGGLVDAVKNACEKSGTSVLQADRWSATTRTCSVCGCYREEKLSLNVRVWQCSHCGSLLDRDYNAAVNIMLAAGLVESLNDCGGDVRHKLACADPREAINNLIPVE